MPARVPPPLRLVESFLNSVDVETDADDLTDLNAFRRWLGNHERPDAARSATAGDLDLARALRRELRDEAAAHHDGAARDRTGLDAL
ncbi:MAG: ABATE domain-containing protein, partial [Actinocatenispora sp.]